jgi:hypothetical protein
MDETHDSSSHHRVATKAYDEKIHFLRIVWEGIDLFNDRRKSVGSH